MNAIRLLLPCFALALVAGCADGPPAEPPAPAVQEPQTPADGSAAIDADDLARHIEVLSSDEYGGRAPMTPGEELTIAYLRRHFEELGLEPGYHGEWLQPVPLVEISTNPDTSLKLRAGKRTLDLMYGEHAMLWSRHEKPEITLSDSDLVFAGYGIVAPEFGWNDYEGLDAAGKTVLVLVNDPGYATQDPELFRGNAMTYYGRWTYKYEEAARQGAAGVIIVHEDGPAGYPWEVVTGSWAGAQLGLRSDDGGASWPLVQGWVSASAAGEILAAAGHSLEEARQMALAEDFAPVGLPWKASVRLQNTMREAESYNVIAMLPGTDRADEAVVYMAHWDHIGTDPSLSGDQIYNGAVDNASGTAALIEIAEAFVNDPQPPRRSILFIAVTAEESGLLGSRQYGLDPAFPLARTVAGINMDGLNVDGRTRDVAIVGYGQSQLDDYLREAAAAQSRVVVPEPTPEKGFFFRSDHFNLARHGVPVLYAESGFDFIDGGVERGRALASEWIAERYHKPADEFSPDWDLSGAVEDMLLYYRVGRRLASEDTFPEWAPDSEFRAAREASLRDAN